MSILKVVPNAIGALLRLIGIIKANKPDIELPPLPKTAGVTMLDKKTAAVITLFGNTILGILAVIKFLVTKEIDESIVYTIGGTTGSYAAFRAGEGVITAKKRGPTP